MKKTNLIDCFGLEIPESYPSGNFTNTYRQLPAKPILDRLPEDCPETHEEACELRAEIWQEEADYKNYYFFVKQWCWQQRKGPLQRLRDAYYKAKREHQKKGLHRDQNGKRIPKWYKTLPEWKAYQAEKRPVYRANLKNRRQWDRLEPRYEEANAQCRSWVQEAYEKEQEAKRRFAEQKRAEEQKKRELQAQEAKRKAEEEKKKRAENPAYDKYMKLLESEDAKRIARQKKEREEKQQREQDLKKRISEMSVAEYKKFLIEEYNTNPNDPLENRWLIQELERHKRRIAKRKRQ